LVHVVVVIKVCQYLSAYSREMAFAFFGLGTPPPPPSVSTFELVAGAADACHLTLDGIVLVLVLAGLFANHLWRVICFSLLRFVVLPAVAQHTDDSCSAWWTDTMAVAPTVAHATLLVVQYLFIMYMPLLPFINSVHRRQPIRGAVFVTGADSGMGEWTAAKLAVAGFTVFAGCYQKDSGAKLRQRVREESGKAAGNRVIAIDLDVTSDASVAAAAAEVEKHEMGGSLVGIINCAGLGFNGPAEYFPISMMKQQMEVNFFGYVRVVQALMPLLKKAVAKPGARRGRIVFIGTGGGSTSPSPPLLCAYMASKFSCEAFCQTLRMEMQLRSLPIDACMLKCVCPSASPAGTRKGAPGGWRRGKDRPSGPSVAGCPGTPTHSHARARMSDAPPFLPPSVVASCAVRASSNQPT
jgi:NAD(P)-dependent dehydrogenase (short-subunit alcohol dehydrogenase family)